MKKNIIIAASIAAVVMAFVYLGFAFVNDSINAGGWSKDDRETFMFRWCTLAAFAIAVYFNHFKNKP